MTGNSESWAKKKKHFGRTISEENWYELADAREFLNEHFLFVTLQHACLIYLLLKQMTRPVDGELFWQTTALRGWVSFKGKKNVAS